MFGHTKDPFKRLCFIDPLNQTIGFLEIFSALSTRGPNREGIVWGGGNLWVWLLSNGANPIEIHGTPTKFLRKPFHNKHYQLELKRTKRAQNGEAVGSPKLQWQEAG